MKAKLVLAFLSLACALSCESPCAAEVMAAPDQGSSAPRRDYWPTSGWKTALPEDHGLDTTALARGLQHLPQMCPNLRSLLVVRDGRLIVERYFGGSGERDPWNIKSASKSILSALVGIALEQGYLRSFDQPVLDFFPEYRDQIRDPRKQQITIRHLLTMSAGLEWDENGPLEWRWQASRDWVGFTLMSKLETDPGARWHYSTALTHVLSALLTKATGTNTFAFAQRSLLGPIGVTVPEWDKDPQGYYWGGSEVYLTPRDMAKFGYLYLNNGTWDRKQIVPATWVQASMQQTNSAHYGFLWWLDTFEGHPIYFAQGLGGQNIVVVPHLDAVIVTSSYHIVRTHFAALSLIRLAVLPCFKHSGELKRQLPPAHEVIARYYRAIGGREQMAELDSLRIAGTLRTPATLEQHDLEVLKGRGNRIYCDTKGPQQRVGSDSTIVWSSSRGYRILMGDEARSWREEASSWSDLRGPVEARQTIALTTFEGRPCYELQSIAESGAASTDFFDAETGLLAGSVRPEVMRPYGLFPLTRIFAEYRRFGDFLFPTKVISQVQGPEAVFTRTTVEYNGVDPRAFDLPIPIKAILKGKRNAGG